MFCVGRVQEESGGISAPRSRPGGEGEEGGAAARAHPASGYRSRGAQARRAKDEGAYDCGAWEVLCARVLGLLPARMA
jgi:hypothetical protein